MLCRKKNRVDKQENPRPRALAGNLVVRAVADGRRSAGCRADVILLAAYRPWESPFEGIWQRPAGDINAPDSMQVQVLDGRLKASFPDRNPLSIGSVTFTLILDGSEHPWSGESGEKGAR
jgi:hypothetical protein